MTTPSIQLDELYLVLTGWALAHPAKVGTYTELSQEYRKRTNDWFEPHGSWDAALGELNQRVHATGAPALSALVVLKVAQEPGGAFWGSAPNVPARPKTDVQRLTEWARIVKDVQAYPWRPSLP